jgi:hypothetical protein
MKNRKTLISFDYAIKFLLKDKKKYGIVEGFISALLKTQGYESIKIISLLESESSKEDPKEKRSIADLVVKDEHHHKYIVEIERNIKSIFVQKACFMSITWNRGKTITMWSRYFTYLYCIFKLVMAWGLSIMAKH